MKEAGKEAWNQAPDEQKEFMRKAGQEAWAKLSVVEQEEVRLAGREAYANLDEQQLEAIRVGREEGRRVSQSSSSFLCSICIGSLVVMTIFF